MRHRLNIKEQAKDIIITILVILVLIFLVFASGCGSYKYVPSKERGAKRALQREVDKIKYKQNRIKAIVLAYPDLADTTTTITTVDVVSEAKADTVEVVVQDTARIDSLYKVIDRMLVDLLDGSDTIVRDSIRWLLREVRGDCTPVDTTLYFTINRKLSVGKNLLTFTTDVSLGLSEGRLFYEYQINPYEGEVNIGVDNVTLDTRRLPRILRVGLVIVGIIIIGVIIGVILMFLFKRLAK